MPFNYFTQGVACSEVEVDCLTGDHRVIRADVLMDVGSSINPALDIGQIEGAFIQGMGWCTCEELTWGDAEHPWVRPAGRLHTAGPGTYKIPSFNDTPESFNVTLMSGVSNELAVNSSKAVGEPPFFMGASVLFAIRDAIYASRAEKPPQAASSALPAVPVYSPDFFNLHSPASSERIRMAVLDEIARATIRGDPEAFLPNLSC
jgi:xanthine dehydrogenase/oxidase